MAAAGSQKGFMLPTGLCIVGVSDGYAAACERGDHPSCYLDFGDMAKANDQGFFPYTPAVTLLRGLRTSIDMLVDEGLDNGARHARLATGVRAAVDAWGLATAHAGPSCIRIPSPPSWWTPVQCQRHHRSGLFAFRRFAGGGLGKGGRQGIPYRPPGWLNEAMVLQAFGRRRAGDASLRRGVRGWRRRRRGDRELHRNAGSVASRSGVTRQKIYLPVKGRPQGRPFLRSGLAGELFQRDLPGNTKMRDVTTQEFDFRTCFLDLLEIGSGGLPNRFAVSSSGNSIMFRSWFSERWQRNTIIMPPVRSISREMKPKRILHQLVCERHSTPRINIMVTPDPLVTDCPQAADDRSRRTDWQWDLLKGLSLTG